MDKFQSPMLASDYKPELLRFPVVASAKIDGIRAVIDRNPEQMELVDPYARSGKLIRNNYVRAEIGLTPFFGLDGELVVGHCAAPNVYNETVKGIMSSAGEPAFHYWVFDIRHVDAPWSERSEMLRKVVADVGHPRVRVLPQYHIFNANDLEVFEQDCLFMGFEGIMVRDPAAKYKYGRSTARSGELLKIKRVSHDEAVIVGFEERMSNANEAFTDELGRTKRSSSKSGLLPANTLGAFVCSNKSKWDCEFNVSTGVLTHAECKAIWDDRDAYVGKTLTFKHLPHGAKDRPRHGRFKGFRDPSDT